MEEYIDIFLFQFDVESAAFWLWSVECQRQGQGHAGVCADCMIAMMTMNYWRSYWGDDWS